MAVNKVTMNTSNGEETLIDLTGDSVTPETLAEGVTAHDASGEQITGTMVASSMTAENLSLTLEDGSTVAFAAVQSLAIPEGNVVKIEDASGNVLWEAQSNEVTITIAGTGNASYCYVSINGVKYTSAATLTVERGTVITCYTGSKECDCGKEGGGNSISRQHGVYADEDYFMEVLQYGGSYDYTVTGNITVALEYTKDECKDCEEAYRDAFIRITEE